MQVARKTVHVFNGPALGQSTFYPMWAIGRETTTEARRPDDSLLRRTVQEWQNLRLPWWTSSADWAPPTDPRLIRATTYLENGTSSSKTEYDYDLYNNVTTTRSFDFGQGLASRYVNWTFETSTGYTKCPPRLRRPDLRRPKVRPRGS